MKCSPPRPAELPPEKAMALACQIEKLSLEAGMHSNITRVNEPELRFIKIEGSIKVRT